MRFRRKAFIVGCAVLAMGIARVDATSAKKTPTKKTPAPSHAGPPPTVHFDGGGTSLDELLQLFVAALAAKDRDAIEALRISEDEYRTIVLPGSVEKGRKPQEYPDNYFQYFWGVMNGKSIYSRASFLENYGGRPLTLKAYSFRKGTKDYAWYRAYQQSELTLVDDKGEEAPLLLGSIAEFRGRFKFISYIRD